MKYINEEVHVIQKKLEGLKPFIRPEKGWEVCEACDPLYSIPNLWVKENSQNKRENHIIP
jgi:uncharacterized protein (DUF927 family)